MNLNLKYFFSLPFWLQIIQSFLQTCQRFPLVIVSLLLGISLGLDDIHELGIFDNNNSYKLFLTAFSGSLWFTASTLFAENKQWGNKKHYQFSVPIFLLFCWNIYALQSPSELDVWGSVITAGLSISFAAWLFSPSDNASVWYFNYQLIAAIFFAAIATVILCGGISLILVSIGSLFELKIPNELYGDTWLIGSLFLAPVYFLAQVPKQFDFARSDCKFPKGVHFILTYVLVPLSLIYMVILYAYFIKIVLKGVMPHGHLSIMISLFGIVGIITHLAIYPIHERGNAIIGWFYRNFYRMMIVPLGLLFLAIGQRISQYGITEDRYLVLACALWFAVLVTLFLIKRQHFKLQSVTISLALFCLVASFGPWSIYNLPINNQFSRLEAILIENNLLIDGKVQVTQQPDIEIQKSISSITTYLVRHDAVLKLRPWIKDQQAFDEEFICEKRSSCHHYSGQKILDMMGIDFVESWQSGLANNHRQIRLKDSNNINQQGTFNISGYDVFAPIDWLSSDHTRLFRLEGDKELSLNLNTSGQLLVSNQQGGKLLFDLSELIQQFSSLRTNHIEISNANKLTVSADGQQLSGKLYLKQISLRNNKIEHIEGYLLLKTED